MLNWYFLKNEALNEGYIYFDKNIRSLPKKANGEINEKTEGLSNNDVDAFRHAYVSGRYVQEYNDKAAKYLGYLREIVGNGYGSGGNNPNAEKNMDLWNNEVGRKYGEKAKTKEKLAKMLHDALNNGELIIDLSDTRKYKGKTSYTIDSEKPVIVLEEKKSGRNEKFVDLITGNIMTSEFFVEQIKLDKYPGYRVSVMDGIPTPMSKPDDTTDNNLG